MVQSSQARPRISRESRSKSEMAIGSKRHKLKCLSRQRGAGWYPLSRKKLRKPLVPDDENLKTAVDSAHLEGCAIDGRVVEHCAVDDASEIDLAIGGVDGQRARILARRQDLDDGVGVGHVLTNDREASRTSPIGSENESAIRVVTDGIGA